MEIDAKFCTGCRDEKAVALFGVKRGRARSQCRECDAKAAREHRALHPEKARAAWQKFAKTNREKRLAADKAYSAADPERRAETRKKSRAKRRDKDREYARQYWAAARAADPILRLRGRVSCYVRMCLLGNKAGRGWESILGYTLAELKTHLERQFTKGMSWDNAREWHIDHIVPLSSFTITGPEDPEVRRAWALPNLRPLWAKDNLRKGSKIQSLL